MESASWAKSHGLMEAPGVLGSAYYGQIDLETGVLNGFGRWTSQETMVEGMWRQVGKRRGDQLCLGPESVEIPIEQRQEPGVRRQGWPLLTPCLPTPSISLASSVCRSDPQRGPGALRP